jgi:hypothetical protein
LEKELCLLEQEQQDDRRKLWAAVVAVAELCLSVGVREVMVLEWMMNLDWLPCFQAEQNLVLVQELESLLLG